MLIGFVFLFWIGFFFVDKSIFIGFILLFFVFFILIDLFFNFFVIFLYVLGGGSLILIVFFGYIFIGIGIVIYFIGNNLFDVCR